MRSLFCFLVALATACTAFAQATPLVHPRVPLFVRAKIVAGASYDVRLHSAAATDVLPLTTYTNHGGNSSPAVSVPEIQGLVVPGQIYRLAFTSTSWKWADVQFNAPPGYSVRLAESGQPRHPRTTFRTADLNGASGTKAIEFTIEPNDGAASLRPGFANPPSVTENGVLWAIGLGMTQRGNTAGTLRWSEQSFGPALLDPLSLVHADPMDTSVLVFRYPSGRIYYISTDSLQVSVADLSPGPGYTITCTIPGSSTWFRRYVVSQVTVSSGFKMQVEVTDKNPDNTTQTDTWALSKVGSVIKIEQANGARRLQLASRAGPGTNEREEIITLDSGPSTTVVSRTYRLYRKLFTGTFQREELIQETLDPDTYFDDTGATVSESVVGLNLTTTYAYYDDPAKGGSYMKLKSVTRADGSWAAYRYYGDATGDAVDAAKWGGLAASYSPWKDSTGVTAANATDTNCHAALYDYVGARDIFRELPSETKTSILGTTVARTTVSYQFSTLPAYTAMYNNQATLFPARPIRVETVRSYTSDTQYLTTIRKIFDYTAPAHLVGRLYSITEPTGKRTSFGYEQLGFFFEYSIVGEAFDGFVTNTLWSEGYRSAADTLGWWGYIYTDPIRLVAGEPGYRRIWRDAAGRVYKNERFPEAETYTYHATGEVHSKVNQNGEGWLWGYQNGLLMSEILPDGTRTNHFYDSFRRRIRTEQAAVSAHSPSGFSAQPAMGVVKTHFTLDAAGRAIGIRQEGGTLELLTSTTYNLAGLPTSTTDARGLVTTFAYTDGGRTVTETQPGGFTKITQRWIDGSPKSVGGTALINSYVSRDVLTGTGDVGYTAVTNYVGTATLPGGTSRWTRTVTDLAGRVVREEKAAPPGATPAVFVRTHTYDAQGRKAKVSEPEMADTLFTYANLGLVQKTGLDVDDSGTLVDASSDRITRTELTADVTFPSEMKRITKAFIYPGLDGATHLASQQEERHGSGNPYIAKTLATDIFGNTATTTRTLDPTNVVEVSKTSLVGEEQTLKRAGLLMYHRTADGAQTTVYRYDALRRPSEVIDGRTGSSLTTYYQSGTGQTGQVHMRKDASLATTAYFYSATTGRLTHETNALGKATYYAYNARGQVIRKWGPATYPVEYEYNVYGEQTALRTFTETSYDFSQSTWPVAAEPAAPGQTQTDYPSVSSAGSKTTWEYDAASGVLKKKTDHAGKAVEYTYTVRGALKTRKWARNITATYAYHPKTGEQTGISYTDGTPTITYTHNRLGHITKVVQGSIVTEFERCVCGKPTRELHDPTLLGGRVVTHKLETLYSGMKGRNKGYQLGLDGSPGLEQDVNWGYSLGNGRLEAVELAGEASYHYSYASNSRLIARIDDDVSLAGGVTYGFKQIFTYEANRDHLATMEVKFGEMLLAGVAYEVDEDGRRKNAVHSGEVYARYSGGGYHKQFAYNDRSEVTGERSWMGTNKANLTTEVVGRNFSYAYDPIGNRTTSGVDSETTSYTRNALNQYTQRTVVGKAPVSGFAASATSVTINSTAAQTRQGDYFHHWATATNTSSAQWLSLSLLAGTESATVNAFVPKTPEIFTYDDDGNLTSDGRWLYTWDAENRLVEMETITAAHTVGAPRQKLQFTYDYMGRRIRKLVSNWSGSSYLVAEDSRFIYHGWNMIGEYRQTATFDPVRTYVWGLDISRTLEDAGGVKGLLHIRDWNQAQDYQPFYDGNGNVLGLLKRSDGAIAAYYEYSPFGEILRASGSYADANPIRFSTKYFDRQTGLVYYGRRYYSPSQGRFLGIDPIAEQGGLNLYGFVTNSPINSWDVLGMYKYRPPEDDVASGSDENGENNDDSVTDVTYLIPGFSFADDDWLDPADGDETLFGASTTPAKSTGTLSKAAAKAAGEARFKAMPADLKKQLCGSFLDSSKFNTYYGMQKKETVGGVDFNFYREFAIRYSTYDGPINNSLNGDDSRSISGPLIAWTAAGTGVYEDYRSYDGNPPGTLSGINVPGTTRYYVNPGSPSLILDGANLTSTYNFHTHPNEPGGAIGLSGLDLPGTSGLYQPLTSRPGVPQFGGAFDGQTKKFFGAIDGTQYDISFTDLRKIIGCQ